MAAKIKLTEEAAFTMLSHLSNNFETWRIYQYELNFNGLYLVNNLLKLKDKAD